MQHEHPCPSPAHHRMLEQAQDENRRLRERVADLEATVARGAERAREALVAEVREQGPEVTDLEVRVAEIEMRLARSDERTHELLVALREQGCCHG